MDMTTFLIQNPDLDRAPTDEEMTARMEKAAALAKEQGIPYISAVVIAGDILSGERSKQWVERGLDGTEAVGFVGSFARLDFVVWAVEGGHLPDTYLMDNLPDLWRGSDPDDSDPRFLSLWKRAWLAGEATIFDSPKGMTLLDNVTDGEWVKVYRGQVGDRNQPTGIAWSTDWKVANKFAKTGGLRGVIDLGGYVLTRWVKREDILAYLVGRGESEVVVDPRDLITDDTYLSIFLPDERAQEEEDRWSLEREHREAMDEEREAVFAEMELGDDR